MGSPTITTAHGPVRGYRDRGVWAYLGIPYAAPPLGPNRMREPQPPAAWTRVFNATTFGSTAPHGEPSQRFGWLFPEVKITGENFLNLNVWTPDPSASGLPVMVWVHGGAFVLGSSANWEYRGSSFARDGVVLVSVNYRLGAEGFLFTGDGIANLGLLDQLAALRWVQENIAAFGGDPARVTLAGHSSGAMSIATLLGMPESDGLFSGLIAMAGACHHTMPPQLGRVVAERLAAELGVEPTAAALRATSPDDAAVAAANVAAALVADPDPDVWGKLVLDMLPFEPTVDGSVLTRPPLEAAAAGEGREVALMVGCNSEEARLFFFPNGEAREMDDATVEQLGSAYGLSGDAVDVYRAGRPGQSPGDLAAAIATDWFYRVPAIRLAEAHMGGSGGTWMYSWTWRSDACGGDLGSAHGVELPFVFDCLDVEAARNRVGDDPPQTVADTTHAAWVRFVAEGDPGWSQYDSEARTTGMISDVVEAVDDPNGDERKVWNGVR